MCSFFASATHKVCKLELECLPKNSLFLALKISAAPTKPKFASRTLNFRYLFLQAAQKSSHALKENFAWPSVI
jgi:hypothetical protein